MEARFISEATALVPVVSDIQKRFSGINIDFSVFSPLRFLKDGKIRPSGRETNSIYLLDGKTRGIMFFKGKIILASSSRLLRLRNDWDRYENIISCLRYSPTKKAFTDERTEYVAFDCSTCMRNDELLKIQKINLADVCKRTNLIVKKASLFPDDYFRTYRGFAKKLNELVSSLMPEDLLQRTGMNNGKVRIYGL